MIIAGGLAHGAQLAAENSSGGSLLSLLPIVLIGLAVYLLFLRPQRSRTRRAQDLQRELVPGQTVMTSGGLFGTVAAVDDDAVLIEVAPGVTTKWARAAIGRVVPPEEALGLGSGGTDDEPGRDAADGAGGDGPVR